MTFYLSKRSRERLATVHPDLQLIVGSAILISIIDFAVLEGLRSLSRQRELVKSGASSTLNSRHLTGHAVDLGAWVSGGIRWDWPLYHQIASAMQQAAAQHDLKLEWGGDWETFPDGPHFQLPWSEYSA
ncbi:MAG: hypothetical protein COA47_06315 [Robiginitomaculum sp.]|nr:MAG: hypothetical protein COA47_06315 [Robiginitomaculum sp.]